MREPFTKLHVHLVWATAGRRPWIAGEVKRAIYAALQGQCGRNGATPLAIGGIEDHVHLVVRFSASVSISDLVKGLKGATSHLVAKKLRLVEGFRWQGGYGAFTVAAPDLPRVCRYVLDQENRHRSGRLSSGLERVSPG